MGGAAFTEYLSGYVIEKSLSVDNVFVWAVIFSSFAIPLRYQHRVLFWGIFGALMLRAVFIFAGTALVEQFWWLLLVFGVVLVFSGIKVVRHRDDEGAHGHDRAVKLLGRFLPVKSELSGQHFLVKEAGKWVATPLLAALVVVEVTDVIFAVDSVPAILAVSREPFIVFSSNAFAILGLRALYFLLGGARAVPLPVARARRDPHLRRREDGRLPLVAHADRRVPRRDRAHPRRGDRLQRGEDEAGGGHAPARELIEPVIESRRPPCAPTCPGSRRACGPWSPAAGTTRTRT